MSARSACAKCVYDQHPVAHTRCGTVMGRREPTKKSGLFSIGVLSFSVMQQNVNAESLCCAARYVSDLYHALCRPAV